jgi:oligopeptide transport system substrate-binding protein
VGTSTHPFHEWNITVMNRWLSILLLVLVGAWGVAAQDTTETTPPLDITLELGLIEYPQTFDPLFMTAASEIDFATNLFIGLTRLDPTTQQIVPALADSWEASPDGLTWTFALRDDVQWVRYNAETATVEALRPVTASDVLYSFQRLCSSRGNGYYAVDVFALKIAGCADGQTAGDGTQAQVSAPNATTFEVTLTAAYSYFPGMTHLWTIRPVPQEAITSAGADWTSPANIITSGAFALVEASPEVGATLIKNPFYPAALWNGGNITRVEMARVADVFDQYARYRRDQLDWSDIPGRDMPSVRQNPAYEDDLHKIDEPVVFYFGFAQDKAPFDDVHVRRAFAAALNREALIEAVLNGNGTPIAHFTPSGLTGAPELAADFDIGYNPDYAKSELAESAYPDCEDLPAITIRVFEGAFKWTEQLVSNVVETLGCDAAQFDVEEIRLNELQALIDPTRPAGERPHIFALGWGPDYPDADSFVTMLACGVANPLARECNATDDLINTARSEPNAIKRAALYTEIEAAFFGEAGEFPIIPLFVNSTYRLYKPWLTGPFATDGQFGGVHFDAYTLDNAQVLAVRIHCDIIGLGSANLRTGPATTFDLAGKIQQNDVIPAVAQTRGRDGYTWWQLVNNSWAREDVVGEDGDCELLPEAFEEEQ